MKTCKERKSYTSISMLCSRIPLRRSYWNGLTTAKGNTEGSARDAPQLVLLQSMENVYGQRADVICCVTTMSDQRSTFCQVKHCSKCALILRAMSAKLKVRCLTMRKHSTTSRIKCWNSSHCRDPAQCYNMI